MIFNSIDEIKQAIQNPINRDNIERGRKIKSHHELHVSGIGLNHFINKIQGIENPNAVSLRKALSKEATVPIYASALKPMSKVFSARGGYWNYEFTNDNDKASFLQLLNNIDGEYSITDWIANKWNEKVNTDPFGLAFVEVNFDGVANVTYKSIDDIYSIKFSSISDIHYVIFEPFTIKGKQGKYYRVVDDKFDYLINEQNENFTIVEDETYINYFNKVPAVIYSTRDDRKSDAKNTWINESLISADAYLLDYTLYTIVKTKIGIPYVWEYETACTVCGGSKRTDNGETCPACKGTGISQNRDVADIIVLPTPENGVPSMTPPAGYVVLPSEVVTKFEETLDREKKEIAEAIWGDGAVNEVNQSAKTAFEINARKENETTKLNEISRNAELFEIALTNLFGIFYFPSTYKGCSIVYGRRYRNDSTDIVLNNYNTGVQNNISTEVLDELISEYWYSLYENNEAKLQECLVRLKTKPFYHIKTSELGSYEISKKDYLKHVYYDMFAVDYEKTKSLSTSTIQEVQTALEQWINTNYYEMLTNSNDSTADKQDEPLIS